MNPIAPDTPAPVIPSLPSSGGVSKDYEHEPEKWEIPPGVLPNIDDLVISDGMPVESFIIEIQMRLLTEPLYSSWSGQGETRPFIACSNVGLFYQSGQPPLVPDAMLSLNVKHGDLSIKEHNSYFTWIIGKPPDVVIEIVSDRRAAEDVDKFEQYARIAVPYYVIFDPQEHLKGGVLRAFELRGGVYHSIAPDLLPAVGLGLKFWQGVYSDREHCWLRWCDREGKFIATGKERADEAQRQAEEQRQRAEEQRQRAERYLAQLRAAGIQVQD